MGPYQADKALLNINSNSHGFSKYLVCMRHQSLQSMTPHGRMISAVMVALQGNIYKKHIFTKIVLTHHY
jgi:hypothetical protein